MMEADTDWSIIPVHMREPLRAYIEGHEPVGHFLTGGAREQPA